MTCSALLAARCHGPVRRFRLIGHDTFPPRLRWSAIGRQLPLCEACVAVARRLGVPLVLEG
jgi:hypothetical protein